MWKKKQTSGFHRKHDIELTNPVVEYCKLSRFLVSFVIITLWEKYSTGGYA